MNESRSGLPLPQSSSCYFCELIESGEDDWRFVHRSDACMVFLNGRQFEQGQCVVVPLRHAPTLLDLNDEESKQIMVCARQLAASMMNAWNPDGILVYQNNGTGSGQEVAHFHLHVVPRREGSDWGLGPPHLARVELVQPQEEHDHRVKTQNKCQAAQTLRKLLSH